MIKRSLISFCLAFLGVPVSSSRAGMYHPDLLLAPDFDEHGKLEVMGFENFMNLYTAVGSAMVPNTPEWQTCQERIQRLSQKEFRTLTENEFLTYICDLIRTGKTADAITLLQRKGRGSFLLLTHQARIFQMQPDQLQDAYNLQYSAVKDYPFPEKLLGLNQRQLAWYERIEGEYYLRWLGSRREEYVQKGRPGMIPGLDPIFRGPDNSLASAVKFIGESGEFEAGTIAAAERTKLPPDAIAIVQQLLLWDPRDARLLWLLGELYNAEGDLKAAFECMERAVLGLGYSHPELRNHRSMIEAVLRLQEEAKEKKRLAEEAVRLEAERKERLYRLVVLTCVALVIGLLAYWQARQVLRKFIRSA